MQKVISLIAAVLFATCAFSQDSAQVEKVETVENPSVIQVVEKWYEENIEMAGSLYYWSYDKGIQIFPKVYH